MFLSGEDTSSASASSTSGGSRTKTKRRLEISFTLLHTSARHGAVGGAEACPFDHREYKILKRLLLWLHLL